MAQIRMLSKTAGTVAASLLMLAILGTAERAGVAAQRIDKTKIEQFIRYTEGYTAIVKMTIDDPAPSMYKGYERIAVHLSLGGQKTDKVYFLNGDGQIVNGTIWNLNESPFLDTLGHLPRNGPGFGPADAKVVIVVFSDFQCPYCREFAKTIRDEMPKKYPKDVRVEFQDFPIDSIHKWAVAAAEVSHCIGDGNAPAFWAFHDWAFEHQEELNPGNLKAKTMAFAKTQSLDDSKVGACLESHAKAGEVTEGLLAGQELGVQQTPTSFINGRLVSGALAANALDAIVDLELFRPTQIPGPGTVKGPDVKILKP